jgi:hypothetical protein
VKAPLYVTEMANLDRPNLRVPGHAGKDPQHYQVGGLVRRNVYDRRFVALCNVLADKRTQIFDANS